MVIIFFISIPFKIRNISICSITIFMIDFRFIFWIRDKCYCYKTMNPKIFFYL